MWESFCVESRLLLLLLPPPLLLLLLRLLRAGICCMPSPSASTAGVTAVEPSFCASPATLPATLPAPTLCVACGCGGAGGDCRNLAFLLEGAWALGDEPPDLLSSRDEAICGESDDGLEDVGCWDGELDLGTGVESSSSSSKSPSLSSRLSCASTAAAPPRAPFAAPCAPFAADFVRALVRALVRASPPLCAASLC